MWGTIYGYREQETCEYYLSKLMITVMKKMCLDSCMQWVWAWVWVLITMPLDRSTCWTRTHVQKEQRLHSLWPGSVPWAMIQHQQVPLRRTGALCQDCMLHYWACYFICIIIIIILCCPLLQCLFSAFISLFSNHLLFPLLYIIILHFSIAFSCFLYPYHSSACDYIIWLP